MKIRKRELIIVLALLIGGALMISGCPSGGGTDPTDPSNPPPPPPPPDTTEYEIWLEDVPKDGSVEITPATKKAISGATVTITLKPNNGFEPTDFAVYQTGYHPLEVNGSGYTYTFTMPASPVRVRVTFTPSYLAVELASEGISVSSTWDEIDALNTLIRKAWDPGLSPTQSVKITTAIDKLVGIPNTENQEKQKTAKEEGKTLYDVYGPPPAYSLGVIRAKMRNAEDLKEWIPLSWPSTPMTIGADVKDDYNHSDTRGTDRTILFYVKADNANLPAPAPEKGWQAVAMADVQSKDTGVDFIDKLDGVKEIPLIYQVGTDRLKVVNYAIWLYPVAQYTVQYESGAGGAVTLQDFADYGGEDSEEFKAMEGTLQTLNATNTQGIGNVGKDAGADSGSGITKRKVQVEIKPSQSNILVSVTTSSGSIVRDISGNALSSVGTSGGKFYPESRQYIIKIRSTSPPTGM